jgi:hypothetical protein
MVSVTIINGEAQTLLNWSGNTTMSVKYVPNSQSIHGRYSANTLNQFNNQIVSKALILSGGGGRSLEVYTTSRHETASVKSDSVSLVFL